jgi:hypothetical protein
MATWINQIQRHTSEVDVAQFDMLDTVIAESVNDCMERCKTDLLYKYSGEPQEVTSAGISVRDSRIIMVLRKTSDRQQNGIKYVVCREKSFLDYNKFANPRSLHFATVDSPVFYIENAANPVVAGDSSSGTLKVFPAPELSDNTDAGAVIYKYDYLTTVSNTSETSTLTTVPSIMVEWIVLVIAEKVLTFKLSEMIHTEEDSELAALISQQLKLVLSQMQKVAIQYMNEGDLKSMIGGQE